jgi:hypothetical protein
MHDVTRSLLRRRFWIESISAGVTAVLALLTLVWRDWIEIIFRFDPDHHNGSVEWLIVIAGVGATIALALTARLEWRRAERLAAGATGAIGTAQA